MNSAVYKNSPSVAVIGSGYWGKNLVRNFYNLNALKLVSDKNETILSNFKDQYADIDTCLALTDAIAEYVSCFGSGTIREELIPEYNSPFAVETTQIKLKDSDLCARVYRSLFDISRQYRESFDVYGTQKTFEWPLIEGEDPVIHSAKKPEPEIPERVKVPDYAHLLPEPIRMFTTKGVYDLDENKHLSFTQGAGHGGSHPHLAHEFVMSLIEDRDPFPNAAQSANWTCVGILAHESALKGGEIVKLPEF